MTEIKTYDVNSWEEAALMHANRVFESTNKIIVCDAVSELSNIIDAIIEQVFTENKEIDDLFVWYMLGSIALAGSEEVNTPTKIVNILATKHSDYGPYNIARFGQRGVIIRLNDKISRLAHLTSNNYKVFNESIADTYLDIVGYAIIGAMLLDCTFFLGLNAG